MDAIQTFFSAHPSAWLLVVAIGAVLALRLLVRLACLGVTVILGIAVVVVALDLLR